MNNKIYLAMAVLLVATLSIGLVSAHQYNSNQDESKEHYREMLDLHRQYFNNEITFEEFYAEMDNEMIEHWKEMPCHGGYGMMGFRGMMQ
jgi:hypothetical protein